MRLLFTNLDVKVLCVCFAVKLQIMQIIKGAVSLENN